MYILLGQTTFLNYFCLAFGATLKGKNSLSMGANSSFKETCAKKKNKKKNKQTESHKIWLHF